MLAVDARARAAYDCVAALVDRGYHAKKKMRAAGDGDDDVDVVEGANNNGVDITRMDVTTEALDGANDANDDDDRAKKIAALFKAMLTARAVREDSTPVEVTPGVYVGSVGAAKNVDGLRGARRRPRLVRLQRHARRWFRRTRDFRSPFDRDS